MVAVNSENRIQSTMLPVNRLAESEIQFREPTVTGDVIGLSHRDYEGDNARHSISERELRIHLWLIERLMLLQEERLKQRNLWYKIRRCLFENRLGRVLGL
jgi:hypothetical protein